MSSWILKRMKPAEIALGGLQVIWPCGSLQWLIACICIGNSPTLFAWADSINTCQRFGPP